MKKNTLGFIILLIITIIITLIFFTVIMIYSFAIKFPNPSDLQYEKCTFKYFELGRSDPNSSNINKCYIYVEKYNIPLEIDNIVYRDSYKEELSKLKSKDELIVSFEKEESSYNLYSLETKNTIIISYDDYLCKHENQRQIGITIFSIFTSVSILLLIIEIIYYKKTGECLPI